MSLQKRTPPELEAHGLQRLEWNDLAVLLAVCRAGSLSGAARSLGHNHSTVFRKVNAIEDKTGVRFFERLPHGYAMTDAGRTALTYAERIESEVHSFGREVLGQDMRLEGRIALTAPEGLAATMAPRMIAGFRHEHPEVSVDIVGSASAFDLARREADLAIRATRKPPNDAVGRRVCDFRFALYASPEYLAENPKRPLADHDFCTLDGIVGWLVPLVWKTRAQGERRAVFSASSTFPVIEAAAVGMGISPLPCYMGDPDPRLVRVSAPIEPLTIQLWLLTHSDLRRTARVTTLLGYLYDHLRAERALFEGKRPGGKARKPFVLGS